MTRSIAQNVFRTVRKQKRAPAFSALAASLFLDENRAFELAGRLKSARVEYDLAVFEDVSPSARAAAKALNAIEKPIGRLAREIKNPTNAMRRVILRLERTAEQSSQSGDNRMPPGSAAQAVRQWLEAAPDVRDLLKEAKKSLAKQERVIRAKERLCGFVLPQIYQEFSGRRFGISKEKDGSTIRETGGIGFVMAAHEAIGLGEISAEAIKSHWANAKKRARQEGGRKEE